MQCHFHSVADFMGAAYWEAGQGRCGGRGGQAEGISNFRFEISEKAKAKDNSGQQKALLLAGESSLAITKRRQAAAFHRDVPSPAESDPSAPIPLQA
jgi:hypothetical protein